MKVKKKSAKAHGRGFNAMVQFPSDSGRLSNEIEHDSWSIDLPCPSALIFAVEGFWQAAERVGSTNISATNEQARKQDQRKIGCYASFFFLVSFRGKASKQAATS
ncbi:hypothetical protein TWF694_005586 [Orbilia ellipsospora]|uniref:Protein-tyrosine-phosphatase n=1 Tax=Orbilia ellipsospora TaxID=2528407 RepID=A0AAV9WTK3_9PEZI